MNKQIVSNVICHLDEAGLDVTHWPTALSALSHLTNSHSAFIYLHYTGAVADDSRDQIIHGVCSRDCNTTPVQPILACESCQYAQLIKQLKGMTDQWSQSRIVMETFHFQGDACVDTPRKVNDFHVLRTLIFYDLKMNLEVQLVILRSFTEGYFHESEIKNIDQLRPQLRRTVQTHIRLTELLRVKNSIKSVLNRIHMGIIILDSKGLILLCNAYAKKILDREEGLKANGSRHCLATNHRANVLLQAHITTALADIEQQRPVKDYVMKIRRQSDQAPLVLIVTRADHYDAATGLETLAIFISDPAQNEPMTVNQLCEVFGLSTAEARVCFHLSLGDTIKELASKLNLSEGTVRQYLKQAYKKTNCRKQVDLVRLALSLQIQQSN